MSSTHSAVSSEIHPSNAYTEVIEKHQVTSHRSFTKSQSRTRISIPVGLWLRTFFSFTPLKPSRTTSFEIGARRHAVSALQPVARIWPPTSRSSALTYGPVSSVPLGDRALIVQKRFRSSLLDPNPSKQERFHTCPGMRDISHRDTPTDYTTSIPVARRHG